MLNPVAVLLRNQISVADSVAESLFSCSALSLALSHFLPLAGNIIRPLNPQDMPLLRYVSTDSVPFTVSESDADFTHLTGNQPRDCDEYYAFAPVLPPAAHSGSSISCPVFALQEKHRCTNCLSCASLSLSMHVTLFPGKGLSIGFVFHHAVADASAALSFIRAWAMISEIGLDEGSVEARLTEAGLLPFLDRKSVTKSTNGRLQHPSTQSSLGQLFLLPRKGTSLQCKESEMGIFRLRRNAGRGCNGDDNCTFGAEVFVSKTDAVNECLSLHGWKIPNFSKLGDIWNSEEFLAGGFRWKMKLYPNGNSDAKVKGVSIYLECVDSKAFAPHEKVEADFFVLIKNKLPPHAHASKCTSHSFPSEVVDWGFSDFIPIADMRDPSKGFIINDCCFLEVEISVQDAVHKPKSEKS